MYFPICHRCSRSSWVRLSYYSNKDRKRRTVQLVFMCRFADIQTQTLLQMKTTVSANIHVFPVSNFKWAFQMFTKRIQPPGPALLRSPWSFGTLPLFDSCLIFQPSKCDRKWWPTLYLSLAKSMDARWNLQSGFLGSIPIALFRVSKAASDFFKACCTFTATHKPFSKSQHLMLQKDWDHYQRSGTTNHQINDTYMLGQIDDRSLNKHWKVC